VLALSPCKFNQTGTDLIEDQSQKVVLPAFS